MLRSLAITSLVLSPLVASAEQGPTWIVGTWQKTLDEDHAPPDVMTFRADGTFLSFGPKCEQRTNHYFVHEGDAYLVVMIPGKGPVALVFRPNSDKSHLTFTSPRTLQNAQYEKIASPPCGRG